MRPGTNELWMSTNERDGLGDNLPPDYISHVTRGRLLRLALVLHREPPGTRATKGKRRNGPGKVMVPDVLVQAHCATLNLCF